MTTANDDSITLPTLAPGSIDGPPAVMHAAAFIAAQKRASPLGLRLLVRFHVGTTEAEISAFRARLPARPTLSQLVGAMWGTFVLRAADLVPHPAGLAGRFIAWTPFPSDQWFDADFTSLSDVGEYLAGREAGEPVSALRLSGYSVLFDAPITPLAVASEPVPAPSAVKAVATEELVERDREGDVVRIVKRPLADQAAASRSPAGTVVDSIKSIHQSGGTPQ